ncbi:hypothetical protein HYE40_02410 [Mycoplasmopsis bovis]|nr:hypothetical protein [Mycoplasmopsis bovis]QQH20908.1 hypothetical protein HYE40_02410 [Mycoplasmopsis bovis]
MIDPRILIRTTWKKFRKDYEKTEKENENLIKNSNYSDVLNNWFGDHLSWSPWSISGTITYNLNEQ